MPKAANWTGKFSLDEGMQKDEQGAEISGANMSITHVAASLKARVPWEVAHKILEMCDVPRGMGWDRTLEKLADSDEIPEAAESDLREAMREHILAGEKLTRFYALSDEDASGLRKAAAGLSVGELNKFAAAYPLHRTDDDIATLKVTKPVLVAIEQLEDGTALVFASIRAQEVREPVDISGEMGAALGNYEEVVGIRHVKRQTMDVLWIPKEGNTVDVRVDFPKGMLGDQGSLAHEHLREQLSVLLGQDYLSAPANLFPLVDRIYRSTTEGVVVELAFGTSTASLKHEKMRRSNVCLRGETYHVGGTTALAVPIAPYRISVQWERDRGTISSRPELSLHGQFRMTHLVDAPLYEAVIRKCVDLDDYNYVRSRLESYMIAAPADEVDQNGP